MLTTYFKIAYRNLSRNKVYGLLNITGLALSITCGILIFTLVKHHLSFDNFHKYSDRIYRFVTEQHRDEVSFTGSVPPPLGKAFRNDFTFGEKVARVATFEGEPIVIQTETGIRKFTERTGPAFAEQEFFEIFNLPLIRGDRKSALAEPNTAVITEHIARKYFGNEDPLNKIIRVSDRMDCKITGILRDIPANTDLRSEIYISWPTVIFFNDWFASDNAWGGIASALQTYVRLKPGISPAQVEKVLPAYVTKFRATSKNVHHYKLHPISQRHFDGRYGGTMEKRNIYILCGIVLVLIGAACVNFINLATAQAIKRSKEVGIKKVLGGRRLAIFWQFITETFVITMIAAVLAICLSYPLLPFVNELFQTSISINLFEDYTLLSFILLLVVVVTFFAGSYPGVVLSGFNPITALKGKLPMQAAGGLNIRRALITTQFSISFVLIIGMIIISRQMQFAKQSDMGFNKDAIVMLPIGVDSAGIQVVTLKNKLAAIPGVESVTAVYSPPASQSNSFNAIRFDNRAEHENFKVNVKSADHQYVSTFDLKLVAGRNLFPSDTTREFLINETMLRKLGLQSPQEAIGRKISFNADEMSATIVGVLKDFHDLSFHEDINAVAITTNADQYRRYAVKINLTNVSAILKQLEKTWTDQYPNKVYEYQFLDEHIAEFYQAEETMLMLIRVFSGIAIFISCLGLYGLIAFMIAQKTKEIGIRKILGGSVSRILWIFGKEFSGIIIVSFLIAAPVSWWLMSNWLSDFEYRIPLGPRAFILAILMIVLIVGVTIGYQAIKAAFANPAKSLRTE